MLLLLSALDFQTKILSRLSPKFLVCFPVHLFQERIHAGKELLEAKRIAEEKERRRSVNTNMFSYAAEFYLFRPLNILKFCV